mmetsp:Transcript_10716/g.35141  ORF Transcript_10716/g.35141 Transcript_10716/m.35141 type:complete len:365 (-) Transcript_10716:194-1288(-)
MMYIGSSAVFEVLRVRSHAHDDASVRSLRGLDPRAYCARSVLLLLLLVSSSRRGCRNGREFRNGCGCRHGRGCRLGRWCGNVRIFRLGRVVRPLLLRCGCVAGPSRGVVSSGARGVRVGSCCRRRLLPRLDLLLRGALELRCVRLGLRELRLENLLRLVAGTQRCELSFARGESLRRLRDALLRKGEGFRKLRLGSRHSSLHRRLLRRELSPQMVQRRVPLRHSLAFLLELQHELANHSRCLIHARRRRRRHARPAELCHQLGQQLVRAAPTLGGCRPHRRRCGRRSSLLRQRARRPAELLRLLCQKRRRLLLLRLERVGGEQVVVAPLQIASGSRSRGVAELREEGANAVFELGGGGRRCGGG